LLPFGTEYSIFPLTAPKHIIINLPPVSYEYENCSFTLREEHKKTAFKRKISGPKREELTG
jgi:hypothetical protein